MSETLTLLCQSRATAYVSSPRIPLSDNQRCCVFFRLLPPRNLVDACLSFSQSPSASSSPCPHRFSGLPIPATATWVPHRFIHRPTAGHPFGEKLRMILVQLRAPRSHPPHNTTYTRSCTHRHPSCSPFSSNSPLRPPTSSFPRVGGGWKVRLVLRFCIGVSD